MVLLEFALTQICRAILELCRVEFYCQFAEWNQDTSGSWGKPKENDGGGLIKCSLKVWEDNALSWPDLIRVWVVIGECGGVEREHWA